MKRIFQKRYPAYFVGFSLGLAAVLMILQMKKAFAPEFKEVDDTRLPIELIAGGSLRLKLGKEPGKLLAWGFPTQLVVGKKAADGRMEPVIRMEYRDLVESETLIGPINDMGEFELRAQFFTCSMPGEKYCAKISLVQPLLAFSGREAPAEVDLVVDLAAAASKAAEDGKVKAEAEATKPINQ
jgi:hypothetical protein